MGQDTRLLTTTTTASGCITALRSSQNSNVKSCSGTPPPEKQSCTTRSYWTPTSPVPRFARLAAHDLASSRKTLLGSRSDKPKNILAASYTAGSISTMVVEMPWRRKAFADIPVPRPLQPSMNGNDKDDEWEGLHDQSILQRTSLAFLRIVDQSPCFLQYECAVNRVT